MQQSPSPEAKSHPAIKEIPRYLWHPKAQSIDELDHTVSKALSFFNYCASCSTLSLNQMLIPGLLAHKFINSSSECCFIAHTSNFESVIQSSQSS
jgi:hypothetical protein